MPINLQGSGNIAEGWGKPPELDAPALGPLVASILANKLARDKMLQEGIGETIKNVREERQSAKYIEALKAAGLVSQDYDAGGMTGAKLGTGLAKMIQDQQELAARERHQQAMEGFTERRTSLAEDVYSGGDGGEEESQFYIDPDTGLRMQRTAKGPKLAPQYAQPDVVPQQTAKEEAVRPLYEETQGQRTKAEELKKKLETRFGAYGDKGFIGIEGGKKERVEAKYLKRINAEKEAKKREAELLKKYPGLAAPQPSAAETGDALNTSKVQPRGTSSYASPDQIRMARARQALDDPQATDAEKEQARKILAGE